MGLGPLRPDEGTPASRCTPSLPLADGLSESIERRFSPAPARRNAMGLGRSPACIDPSRTQTLSRCRNSGARFLPLPYRTRDSEPSSTSLRFRSLIDTRPEHSVTDSSGYKKDGLSLRPARTVNHLSAAARLYRRVFSLTLAAPRSTASAASCVKSRAPSLIRRPVSRAASPASRPASRASSIARSVARPALSPARSARSPTFSSVRSLRTSVPLSRLHPARKSKVHIAAIVRSFMIPPGLFNRGEPALGRQCPPRFHPKLQD